MNVILVLAIILFILMISIGGLKGMRSFISLFLNFAVILLTVMIMLDPQANPLILTAIACAIISCINLFFINEINSKTINAFISILFIISILLFFILFIMKKNIINV